MIPQQQPIAKGKIRNNHHRKQRSSAKANRAKRNLRSKTIIGNNSQETVDLTPQAAAVGVALRFTLATRDTFDFHVPDASRPRKPTPLPYPAYPLPPEPGSPPQPPDPVDPASTPNDMTATTAEAALAPPPTPLPWSWVLRPS